MVAIDSHFSFDYVNSYLSSCDSSALKHFQVHYYLMSTVCNHGLFTRFFASLAPSDSVTRSFCFESLRPSLVFSSVKN